MWNLQVVEWPSFILPLFSSLQNLPAPSNPYHGFIYTSFQERATAISHGNTARQAKHYGDDSLAVVCGLIAADEKRHEQAYCRIVEQLFERDASGAMLAFEHMMRKKVRGEGRGQPP